MAPNKHINNVDRFFLLMGIIADQIHEFGSPDAAIYKRFMTVVTELSASERKEVQDRYFREMIENDLGLD